MSIPYIRGWIGLLIFVAGVGMLFFPQTSSMGPFGIGFGGGMMASGFHVV